LITGKEKKEAEMCRKPMWLMVSCLVVMALVLGSCGPALEEEVAPEGEEVAPEEEEEVVKEAEEEAGVEEEKEMVLDSLGRLVEKPQYGGALIFVAGDRTQGWRLCHASAGNEDHLAYVYERLGTGDWTRGAGSTTPECWAPALATSWEQPDPQTFIFHIRKGVHFQNKPPLNGREMTAEDVAWSFTRYKEHPDSLASTLKQSLVSATALDKWAVEFKLAVEAPGAYGLFGWLICNFIHPHEVIETYGEDGFFHWRNACGTGPFTIDDQVVGSSITYKRNPTYWCYDELHPQNQLPYVDYIRHLIIPDKSTRMAALRTGKIDRASADSDAAYSLKKTTPELLYHSQPTPQGNPMIHWRLDREPFSDIRVRQALFMAIDRDTIIREYLRGEGTALSWPMCAAWPEAVYTPVEELPPAANQLFEYNPERAKELLAQAGYPIGFETEVLTTEDYVERMSIFVSYWEAIGVKVNIRLAEGAAYSAEVYGFKYPGMAAGPSGQGDPATVLWYGYSTSWINKNRQDDPYYDEAIDNIFGTYDEVERNKLIKELAVYQLEQAYQIAFPGDWTYSFWWPWLKNYYGQASMGAHYSQAAIYTRVWIDQNLKESMGY